MPMGYDRGGESPVHRPPGWNNKGKTVRPATENERLRARIEELEELAEVYMNRTWDVLHPGNLSEPDPTRAHVEWMKADEELRRALAGKESRDTVEPGEDTSERQKPGSPRGRD